MGSGAQLDDLFGPTHRWEDGISAEMVGFLDELAIAITVRRREPVWAEVLRHVRTEYSDDAPKSWETIAEAVRRRVS